MESHRFEIKLEQSKAGIISDFVPGSNIMLIAFGGLAHKLDIPPFEFFKITADFAVSKMFVRDFEQAWYHKGISEFGASIDEVAAYIKNEIRRKDINRVITVGTSAGGYAALLFGYLLEVDEVLAFGAQTFLDLHNRKISQDDRWGKNIQSLHSYMNKKDEYLDLKELFKIKEVKTIFNLYFCESDLLDKYHANHLRNYKSVKLHSYERGGHIIVRWMKKQGLLQPILLDALFSHNSESNLKPDKLVMLNTNLDMNTDGNSGNDSDRLAKKDNNIQKEQLNHSEMKAVGNKYVNVPNDSDFNRLEQYIQQARLLKQQNQVYEFITISYKILHESENPPFWIYKNLGKIFSEKDELEKATEFYEKAIKLQPRNIDLHRVLAKVKERKGDTEGAIDSYRKILMLKPDLPAIFYLNAGNFFQKNQLLDEAIKYYEKSLEVNPDFTPAYKKTVSTYQKKGVFKSRFYLVNHTYKMVYCFIPKNACTLFTTMMVEKSDEMERYKQSGQGVHTYIATNKTGLRLTDCSVLKNPDYFKFVILRNPFDRLVSAYLDKFAKTTRLERFARNVVQEVHEYLGIEVDVEKSITFRQFMNYLARKQDQELDMHWRPQHTFLSQGLFNFDFVGQFEKLEEVIQYLEQKFGFEIRKSVSNHAKRGHVTQYGIVDSEENFCDKYPKDLRILGYFPKAKQFYTPDLEEIVRLRYAQDIYVYEQEYNLSLDI